MTARETYEIWVQSRICGPRYWDVPANAKMLGDWIDRNRNGIVSIETLSEAEHEVANHLHWKPESMTAAEIGAKAEQERREKTAAAQLQVVQTWLAQHCPRGLLCANGEPFPGDQDRIVAFVVKNYQGQFSYGALNDAVTVLGPVLTWMSSDPADREIRNRPAPPPRKLSEQAMIDAGMKRPRQKSHADTDGQFVDPSEKLKNLTKKLLGGTNPWEAKANAILIQGRMGRIDAVRTAELRKVIVRRGKENEIDWELTFKRRNELADAIDRVRNRD